MRANKWLKYKFLIKKTIFVSGLLLFGLCAFKAALANDNAFTVYNESNSAYSIAVTQDWSTCNPVTDPCMDVNIPPGQHVSNADPKLAKGVLVTLWIKSDGYNGSLNCVLRKGEDLHITATKDSYYFHWTGGEGCWIKS